MSHFRSFRCARDQARRRYSTSTLRIPSFRKLARPPSRHEHYGGTRQTHRHTDTQTSPFLHWRNQFDHNQAFTLTTRQSSHSTNSRRLFPLPLVPSSFTRLPGLMINVRRLSSPLLVCPSSSTSSNSSSSSSWSSSLSVSVDLSPF